VGFQSAGPENFCASGLKPAVACLLKRFGPGGDQHVAVEFCCGAQVSDPARAKTTLTSAPAHCLVVDKLHHFHPLDQAELVHALKLSFVSSKTNTLQATKKEVDVSQ
jgi:hypothetical protein